MTQFVSKEKKEELIQELQDLQKSAMPETAKRIDEAKEMGDLKENAEYHAAREKLAWQISRVKEIEHILANAQIIQTPSGDSKVVTVGSTIVAKLGEKEKTFTIVGAQEADPLEGKISNESPLGSAFLGAKVGDEVEVEIPAGTATYTVISLN